LYDFLYVFFCMWGLRRKEEGGGREERRGKLGGGERKRGSFECKCNKMS
jgi:hypothetical protein